MIVLLPTPNCGTLRAARGASGAEPVVVDANGDCL